MDGLEYLSQWNDDDDADYQRPTPLDPEYWRGITHSCEPAREVYYHDPYPVAHPSATCGNAGMNAYPMGGGYQAPMATHRPMTAPSGGHGAYGYPHGVVTSPIHYQSARALPISPVTHDDRFFDGHAGVNASMGWGTIQARSGFTTSYASPQAIKAELRDAFVRAQSFANIQSLLQSFDPSHSGVISLRALQEGLLMVGVNVSGHTLQSIGQLYGTPGSGMVDYFALSRLLDVDPHEWDQIRAAIQGRRGSLAANGFDFTQIFLQNDHTRSGSVPRTIFMSILRDCGLGIPEATLHFMAIHLAAPFDTTSVAYGRFLELIGLGGMPGWGAAAHNAHTFGHRNSWSDNRGLQIHQEAYARPYDPPLVTAAPIRRESYVGSASVEVAMPRHGWICRVCAHQQIEDWVTHCEICETSKPKTGKYGGFIKCTHCKFDNNYDMEDCEICGRPLVGGKKASKSSKKRSSKSKRSSTSSSESSSSSDSSSHSRRSSRSGRRKSVSKSRSGRGKSDSKEPRFRRGEEIQAIPLGERDFEIGVIARVHSDGTYDIHFDSGQYEKRVDEGSIQAIPRARTVRAEPISESSKERKRTQPSDEDEGPRFDVGDKVEAQFNGGDRFFKGTIQKRRADGTYDILYDDSEVELKVKGRMIRKYKPSSPKKAQSPRKDQDRKTSKESESSSSEASFSKGQKVEVKVKGSDGYVKGTVFRVYASGGCDVELETGELEKQVPNDRIRSRAGTSPAKKPMMKSDDEPIRPKRPVSSTPRKPAVDSSSESSAPPAKKFRQGQKIEARYKGNDKYYPGVISRCRLNGTYDVDYDDGEKETAVKPDLIRAKESSSPTKKGPPPETSEDEPKKKLAVGQKVEARYKGKDKYYPGVISRCRLNGTFDIDYDDGEKETGVSGDLVRLKGGSSSPSKKANAGDSSESDVKAKPKLAVGQKIEAKYKGKDKYYPGVISRCRLNGTYDIDYDDGEKETGVGADLVRATSSSSPKKKPASDATSEEDTKSKKKFTMGQTIEAQYKGKTRFYAGVIARCRLNGTYDIDYDDGEKETGVDASLIRARETDQPKKKSATTSDAEQGKKKFKVGQPVEAKYKGKERYYSGVISRCRLNGTYDIDYDDGEKETGVAADLIKEKAQKSPTKSSQPTTSEDDVKPAKKFREGDKVEAQYKGKSKFYPGVISRCRLNGTYDINYDDGEKETGVAAELIRLKGGSASPSKKKASDDSEDDRKPKKLKEGDKVEAQYKGKSKFYPGVISRCRLNGTYDIDYDDGEKETGVAAELIRLKEGSSPSKKKSADDSEDDRKPKKLKEGDKVEAQYKGKSKFYPGVISRCRLNGTYDIDYDDGEKETGVAAELIRLKGGSASPSKKKSDDTSEEDSKKKKFREGEKVEVQYKGKSKYYPGVISRCRLNGTYDINYDDGEKETGVGPELIRSLEASKSPKKKIADDSEDDRKPKKFKEGDKVEAQYKGKSKFYPGVISRCRLNGTYDIDYDDGEKETGVAAELIRSKGGSSSPSKKKSDDTSEDDSKKKKFKEGEKVEAQYKGKSKFYPGVISRCRLNGTYDIDYDDGEKETGVAAELIRSLEAKSPKKKSDDSSGDDRKGSTKFREGEKVEAQYKGKSRFYPGVISRCRLNGTYDIDYDDGEKETGVAPELIRSTEKSSSGGSDGSRKEKKFKEGEKVEAQYKGKIKFYPGVISRCRLNGTYDIDYDDGEKETGVAAELIRSREASGGGSKKLKEGDKVEAQYKGKSKFYPGVISRCRLNGTYDIDYDDGEKETGVAAELIRLKESSSLSKKKAADDSEDDRKAKKFREGDKIEAQYKGKSKFYPGVISRCRLNGTYDIDYDDGEKETGVAAELIRSRNSGDSSARGEKKFREGDKVEAQYKGKSKFYPGVISRCRLNGTYDIDYDDGEKETGVAAELIRLKGGSASPSKKKASDDSEDDRKPKKLKEGDKVEAQYKGKSKFYPGVISRCRLNGTYDIDYDDGEKETGVAAELIRLKEGSSPSKKKSADDSEDDRKPKKLKEGDKVEAQYKGKSKFYPGVISRCRLNGTYDIDYDDGEKETGVAAELIRLKGGSASPSKKKSDDTSEEDSKKKKFREGEKVEVQYKGKSKYYPGVISRCRLNGTYDINYDDGEKETGVGPELIRSLEASKSPKKKIADDSEDDRKPKKFKEGDKVEAQYKGKSKFYPGVISRCRLNGTYDIDYDDGEKETGVAAELIRSKGGSSSPSKKKSDDTSEDDSKKKKFKEGEKVEAQYKGKSKFYPGVISRCRLNGTYDIDYDDGEKETGVAAELIRSLEAKSPKKKSDDSSGDDRKGSTKFREGEKVEAQYKGKSRFYPGVISRCRLNGTYDIDYDDGEKETGVAPELIRSTEKSSSGGSDGSRKEKKFKEGEKVEAQYKGKIKFYPGVISRCRLNGTYDIDYDDGEKETGVAAELIRSREASGGGSKKLKEGDKVEAQYKGKSKFYPGVISRCRLNGTYDIDYDDGEKETGVAAELIRLKESSSLSKKKAADDSEDDRKAKKFREGDKIEAQYKGKSKFYPGVISRCRLNGTYDIDYDDGEKETGVAAELIRSRNSGDSSARGEKKFREGDKVEAQYKGKSKFYPGVISRCRLNGTYDIDYDDGEKETGVAAELIRLKGGSASPSKKKASDDSEDDRKPKKLKEGDKVEAQYKGKSKFYPGVISRCRLNGTYDIDYDDGEKETGVAAELIRLKEGSSPSKKKSADDSEDDRKPKKLKEGDKVEAQYKGKSKFYPGVISRCRLNGTYDIDYDDGEKETGVAAELIRLKGGSASPSKKKSDDTSEEDSKKKKFREGEKVEVQYKGKSKYYPGVISRCRLNGTYDINYDDGEKETGVGPELIRSLEASKSPKKKIADDSEDDRKPKKFKEGDKVEAQYKGKSKFYPGVISRCRLNGTYDIDYDDGEKETGVAAELIRSKGGSSSPSKKKSDDTSEDDSKKKKFKEGEKVEAQYKGKSKFYPGVISRCRLNGTYDIDYDDGEKETGVAAELIRSLEAKSPKKKSDDSSGDDRKGSTKFREGEKVEAQYKGKSRFYPGVISRCRLNGTYDIDYDDGEKETGVAPELIRSTEKSSSGGSDGSRKEKKFKEGEKVEAQYKGKIKFYPGVISRCRLNGTYDIDYDDGEKETGVAAELIRSREASGGGSKKLKEGDKVEAQYKGKSKFYPGVISRCRLNGTYDIDYDDGEKETGVAAELIRLKESSSLSKKKAADDSEDDRKAKKFREGDKIEAQYKGKSKFYPGVISRCRLNGTYDIDYDDGEKETGVAAELIRSRNSGDSSARGEKKFREGDKVEAQYKGKSKFYPGVISRCRLNGTYDIDYDDGEKETGVAAELIRLKGGSASPSKKKASDDSEDDRKPKKLKEGDKVEAQYKGKSKFYPGVISRCRLNGTYDIDYDDGEKETGVAAELIRLKEGSSPSKKKSADDSEDDRKPKKLKEGDKVEAQYKGKSKFYPGVISRCRLNGTYDIDYDDGEKETGVAAELIRLKGGSASPSKKKSDDTSEEDSKKKKFREGEKVEVQYKGKSKYYPGVISRCRLNGTYDINYDDGEKETGVGPELIRSLEASKTPRKAADDRELTRSSSFKADLGPTFRVGTRIEALYHGKDKYYKGTISKANADGTYDVEYDDGDKESKVPARNIRPLKTSNFSATAEFSVDRPSRPSASNGARRRSGNSSD